ncbi:MAG TPA: MFS transporter, partial [Gaiellales bacterium]|nr:MFS transporter [Gaiellales bacterium]
MSPRPRTTLIIAVIAQAAVSVVQFGLPAIGVEIQNKFGLGPAGFGAVFAAVGLGSAVALIPAGMLVDRFGARPVLLIGAAINFCAYLAASVAPNAALFAAAIFLAGIGSSAVPVAGMSSLLREFPPERRGIALGWRQLAVPMGGAIGAAALPLLAHVGGVQLALVVTAFATA